MRIGDLIVRERPAYEVGATKSREDVDAFRRVGQLLPLFYLLHYYGELVLQVVAFDVAVDSLK
jgi:hypothetical protein